MGAGNYVTEALRSVVCIGEMVNVEHAALLVGNAGRGRRRFWWVRSISLQKCCCRRQRVGLFGWYLTCRKRNSSFGLFFVFVARVRSGEIGVLNGIVGGAGVACGHGG